MRCRGVAAATIGKRQSSPAAKAGLSAPQFAVYDGMKSTNNTITGLP
jgi:hypothetical protein